MGLSLTAQQKSVIKLFSAEDKYLIPSYQRPYSWDTQQCSDLWEDLKTFFDTDKYSDGYFLGNIVIAKSKESEYYEVIDGQQRLITITLLVKALSFYDNNKALDSVMHIIDRRSEKTYPRLKSAVFEERDNDFLLECLNLKEIPKRSRNNSRFMENLAFFCEKIRESLMINDKKFDISKFSDFILDNVHLLPIQSEDQEEEKARNKALTIFETINNRGLDLFDADIFKAQLYVAAANQSKQEEFIRKWNELVENSLSIKQNIDDIFRIYMHIQRGLQKDSDSEIGLRQFFTQDTTKYKSLKKQNFSSVLDDLTKVIACVSFFYKFVNCQNNEDSNINQSLTKWFQIIDIYSNNYPKYAIFVYLFKYGNLLENGDMDLNDINKNNLEELIKSLIRYVYYAGATSTVKFKIFKIIVDISSGNKFEYFVSKTNESDFLYFGKIKKGFMLLYIYLNEKQSPICNYQIDSMIKKSNRSLYPEIDIDSIGNYLLVDDNSYKTRNKSFDIRKIDFTNSPIIDLNELSKDILDWDTQKNNQRTNEIKNKLIQFFTKE